MHSLTKKVKGTILIQKYEKKNDVVINGIVGAAIGDAIGVPVEFLYRKQLSENPVTGMRAHGTHNQPAGTWSDDTSMILATASALSGMEFDPERIATAFLNWRDHGAFSPDGMVFDIGLTTNTALNRFKEGTNAILCGGNHIEDNGNGSLMRILPVAFFLYNTESFEDRKQAVYDASAITHRHPISKIACHFYVEFLIQLVRRRKKDMRATAAIKRAYSRTTEIFRSYCQLLTTEVTSLMILVIQSLIQTTRVYRSLSGPNVIPCGTLPEMPGSYPRFRRYRFYGRLQGTLT